MLRLFRQYYPIRNIFFVVGEGLFIFVSVLIASWLHLGIESLAFNKGLYLKTLLIAFVCQTCLYYNDLYDLQVTDTFSELGIRLLQAIGGSAIFLAGFYIIFPDAIIGRGVFVISVGFVVLFIVAWRLCYTFILNRGLFNEKIIVLGSGELFRDVINEIKIKKDSGYTVSVVVPESHNDIADDFIDSNLKKPIYKKGYDGLCELAKGLNIKKVVVALEERRGGFPTKELLKCRVDGIAVLDGNSFYEMLTGKLIVEHINPAWLIFSEGFRKSRGRRFFKRSIDLFISFVMLVLSIPVFIVIAILIKIDSKGPIIFPQERVGQRRRPYLIYKFRSMYSDAEKKTGPVWAEDDDPRITRAGKFLRNWRFDELPQLWNVLKGNMSFVGPRPEREFFVKELEKTIPYYGERFSVKPGITGWAQVSYGYGATVDDAIEKLNYDLFYIKNMSIFMDLMIVLKTIKIVLFGKGAR